MSPVYEMGNPFSLSPVKTSQKNFLREPFSHLMVRKISLDGSAPSISYLSFLLKEKEEKLNHLPKWVTLNPIF